MIPLAPPAIALSLLFVGLYSSAWTVWRGRSWRDWLLHVLVTLVGVSVGQWIGMNTQLQTIAIGQVYIVPATVCSLLALWMASPLRKKS